MQRTTSKKRKAVTKDVEPEEVATASGDEYDFGQLNGTLNDDDSDAESSDDETASGSALSGSASDDDGVTSPLEAEEEDGGLVKKQSDLRLEEELFTNGASEDEAEDERPAYRVVKDANGNDRFIYPEIDPGEDSDYSVPDDEANTIGDIPLSFYESFPHIGYNINGKKIIGASPC